MTSSSSTRPTTRQFKREAAAHLFAIGQAVRLKDGFARPTPFADIFRVTSQLPPRGDSLQYRIRNDDERHERVTTQDNLEPVGALPSAGASLVERTFGHG